MKKTLFVAAALLFATTLLHAGPESKLEKSFRESFPAATNAKWIKDDNGYVVSFKQDNTLTRICYNNNGKFVSSLRYYQGKDLPTNVLIAVTNKYKGKSIFGVVEVTDNAGVLYHVKLYDGTNYYSVMASSDGTLTDENDTSDDDNGK